jgi:hypothetical protein
MKRFGHAIRAHLTYANIVATLALVLAMGGTAAAAVIVKSNSQVAANTISGHHPPSGRHSNLIAGSVNGTDLSSGVKSSFKVHCRAGLQLGGDLCFDRAPRAAADFFTALAVCENAELRLPDVGELIEVFQNTGAPQPEEWTSDFDDTNVLFVDLLDEGPSRSLAFITAPNNLMAQFRCVGTPTN